MTKKRKLDPDHPDFDSEEEYGNESQSDSESCEYDDGMDHGEDANDGDSADEEAEEEAEEDGEEDDDDLVSDEDQVKAPEPKKPKPERKYTVKLGPADEYLIKREATLISLLRRSFNERVIIFCNEKIQCTRLMALMTMYGFKAAEVHGNMEQKDRLFSIEAFQNNEVNYLIATDVIARGLDIPNVKAVINFSFPTEPKRYLHRIGRTARAGQHGVSITLCNEEERKDLKKLSRKLGQNVNTFTIQNKLVEPLYSLICSDLDVLLKDIQADME